MTENLLRHETSPYLRQHQDNPVHWRPWSEAALAEAAEANKPILLSVGYAACHWCHVMAHESFEDEKTAALMNELFVNIKVDREERPDLDVIYQAALSFLGEHGGWPLTMFLTPKGEPFWGGTYFPPEPRYGRAGFPDVLRRVFEAYRAKPEAVRQSVLALKGALEKLSQPAPGGALVPNAPVEVAKHLVEAVDKEQGGFGGAPKFPQSPAFELLWRAYLKTGDQKLKHAVTLTLDRMSQGGIYDHLGGGFARYAVDAEWLVPHFEKMLYDNALLIDLLTVVWQETRDPLYRTRVAETVGWVLREMRHSEGGIFSSLDADSEGEEGKFYVWTEAEIDRLLGAAATEFKAAYDVTPRGNWEGYTILNRRLKPALGDEAHETQLATARAILFDARAPRIRPGLDDKILADWNGLMIAALANASAIFDQPEWLDAARAAFMFIQTRMGEGDRLRHSWSGGHARHPATLDDHANMARAALALFEATGEGGYLAQAETWMATIERHYVDAKGGAYFFTADDTKDVITRTKQVHDQAVPSGNGTMVGVLARLFYLTGKGAYRTRAEALVQAVSGELERNVFGLSTLLNAHAFLSEGIQIILVGRRDEESVRTMLRAIHDVSLPDKVVQVVENTDGFSVAHPAFGKGRADGHAAAYVCRGPVCSLPITDAAALRENLQAR